MSARRSPFDTARAVADAVLYEGYLLYPYHSGATKNQVRWQFGVLVPAAFAAAGSGEHAASRTECLLEPAHCRAGRASSRDGAGGQPRDRGRGAAGDDETAAAIAADTDGETENDTVLHVQVRFLQLVDRSVWSRQADGALVRAQTVRTATGEVRGWQEAVPHEVDALVPLPAILGPAAGDPARDDRAPAGTAADPTPTPHDDRRRVSAGDAATRADAAPGRPPPPDPTPDGWTIPVTAPGGHDVEPVYQPAGEPGPAGGRDRRAASGREGRPSGQTGQYGLGATGADATPPAEAAEAEAAEAAEATGAPADIADDGEEIGRVVRDRWPIEARLTLSARRLPGPWPAIRLRADLTNTSPWTPPGAGRADSAGPGAWPENERSARNATPTTTPTPTRTRDEALRHSLIAAHLVINVPGWRFLSLADPPAWAAGLAADCVNERTWPVVVSDERAGGDGATTGGRAPDATGDDTVLSAPIILPDHPRIAPESTGEFYDATEIDELLTLRARTLTDEEKALARATDPRAAELLDRADHLPDDLLERLHGAVREVREVREVRASTAEPGGTAATPAPGAQAPADPTAPTIAEIDEADAHLRTAARPWWEPGMDGAVDPERDDVLVGGVRVTRGSTVRLAPGDRSADAQDMFLAGRTATVAAVFHDVDGACHLAVTLDDDPGADLAGAVGRYRYFAPEDVVPLDADAYGVDTVPDGAGSERRAAHGGRDGGQR